MACITRETYEHGNSLTTSEATTQEGEGCGDAHSSVERWDNTTHQERRGITIEQCFR